VVDSAFVELADGITFSDGSSTASLKVPSGSESGLKVNFAPAVQVTEGETVLVVDFDLSHSFVFQGPPGAPISVHFQPVLHATATDVAASVSGTVTPVTDNTQVFAINGNDTLQTTIADPTTGAYTLAFLAPGTYIVAAHADGFTDAVSAPITLAPSAEVTDVDLVLIP
jgi:Domain of unknown function (DUF4382)